MLDIPVIITFDNGVVLDPVSASVPIRLSFLPAAILSGADSVCVGFGGNAATWSAVVTIDDVDVSTQLGGDILVEAEEGAARIAELTLRLSPGTTVSLPAWTGKSITIDVVDYSTGVARWPMRLFTGVIDTPALDPAARTILLRCTDDLQGRCDAMSQSALAALVGGYNSPAVFDVAATGWTMAQDRLSTIPASLDISPEGVLRLTPWSAKLSPDLTFTDVRLGDQSLSVSVANRASLVNSVLIDFSYRFPRVKAEGYRVGYTAVEMTGFSTFITAGRSFMQRAQVEAAIAAAGGHIESIAYTPLPTDIIAVGAGYWSPGPYDATLCMAFTALVSFDYAQTIEEQHLVTVSNALSIAAVGAQRETINGALEGVYPDLSATETTISRFKEKSSSIPPTDVAPVNEEKTTSSEVTLTADSDRAAANAALETLIAIAKTRIAASHRANEVSATVPLIPAIDVDKTIRVDADGVLATGKCRRVIHRLSIDSGAATSEFSIALSALAGVGVTHASDPTAAPSGTAAGQTTIAAPPVVTFNNLPTEDLVLTVTFPGVEAAERANAVHVIPSGIAAPIDEDLFSVTI